MVHVMHHLQQIERQEQEEWFMRYAIFNFRGARTKRNGARSAPFTISIAGKPGRMVHMMHHSWHPKRENQEEWCTTCTIYSIHEASTSQNGVRDAPF
jgi:hypothetical protein